MSNLLINLNARDGMSRVLGKASQSVAGLSKRFSSLNGIMGPAAASFTAFAFGASFIEANAGLERFLAQMESLTGSADKAKKSFDFVVDFQDRFSAVDLNTITDAYKELISAGINPTTGALQDLLAGATKFQLSNADVKGVTRALRQMTAMTNAQKQELDQLAERIPNITNLVADELNLKAEEMLSRINKRMISGRTLAAATLRAIGKDSEEVLDRFSNTYDAGINRVRSSWRKLMLAIGETGAFDLVKSAIDKVAGAVTSFNNSVIKKMGDNLFTLAKSIWGNFSTIYDIINDILKIDVLTNTSLQHMNGFVVLLISGFKTIEIIIRNLANHWSSALDLMSDKWDRFKDYISESTGGIIKGTVSKQSSELDKLSGEIVRVAKKLQELQEIGQEELERRGKGDFIKIAQDRLKELGQQLNEFTKKSVEANKEINSSLENNNFAESLSKDFDDLLKKMQKIMTVSNEMFKPGNKTKFGNKNGKMSPIPGIGNTKDAEDELDEYLKQPDTFAEGWRNAFEKIENDSKESFGSMTAVGRESAKAIHNAFESGMTNLFDNIIEGKVTRFRDLMLSVIKDIARAFSRLASEQIATGLAGSLGSIFSGGGGGVNNAPGGANGAGINPNTGAVLFKASTAPQVSARGKAVAPQASSMKVEVINQGGELLQASETRMRQDFGTQVMTIVLDAVRTNRGGARTSLKGSLS